MLIGNKQTFAIEVFVDETQTEGLSFLLGNISIWINGEQLGDPYLCVDLNVPVILLKDLILPIGSRNVDVHSLMGLKNAFYYFENYLFENGYDAQEIGDKKIAKLCVLPNISEAFDGEILFFLESKNKEIFVWRKFGEESIQHLHLPQGSFNRIIHQFLDEIKALQI